MSNEIVWNELNYIIANKNERYFVWFLNIHILMGYTILIAKDVKS